MAKEKWETVYPGVVVKKHPTRKHGIKPDLYFTVRYQFNGKRKTSRLGWSSQGWTMDKAITRLVELKNDAETGDGFYTHNEKKVRADEERKKQERQEQERKDSIHIAEYFNDIYYPAICQAKKLKTHRAEEQLFRIWIKPVIGKKPFKDISMFDLERIKKRCSDAGKAPRTIEYCLTTLGQIFRHAERTGYFTGDVPTTKVKKPKFDNKRVRFLSLDEAHMILDHLQGRSQQLYDMALLSLHCGLRAGEIFSLTWGGVDMEHGLINLLDTKPGRNRTLSMTDDVKAVFTNMGPGRNRDFVFPSNNGKKIINISHTFTRAVKEVGLNDGVLDRRQKVTFHTLRHTFASWLVMAGISLYEVKELLGHASLAMTERYSHLSPDRNKRAANIMGGLFQQSVEESGKMVDFLKAVKAE